MDFNLTEEQRLLKDGVSRYVRDKHPFVAKPQSGDGQAAGHQARWHDYAEMGWLGLALSPDVGGLGCSIVETTILTEEFGRGLVVEPYVATVVLGAGLLDRCTSSEARQMLLPGVIQGGVRLSLAHSEEGTRYDLSRVRTTAARAGEGFLLNGKKMLAMGADLASHLIVSAVLEDGTMGLFVVEADAQGVARRDYRLLDGSVAADVDFTGVKLGPGALLERGAPAGEILEEAVDRAILASVAEALGVMERAVELTSEHIKTRIQFGRPLGQFQALQHLMAESFVELQESRSILLRGMASIEERSRARTEAVSSAKAYVGQAGKTVGGNCVQLHGAIGVTEEHQIGHCYRKLVLFEKMLGDCEYHLRRAVSFA